MSLSLNARDMLMGEGYLEGKLGTKLDENFGSRTLSRFAFSIRLFRMEISLAERVVDPHTREESEYGKSIKLLSMFVCKIDLFRIEYSYEVYVEG